MCVPQGSCENEDLIQQVWGKPEICISNRLLVGPSCYAGPHLSNQAVDDSVVSTWPPQLITVIVAVPLSVSLCIDFKLVVILYQVVNLLQVPVLR